METNSKPDVDQLTILGAGVMGTGIAAMVLGFGVPVVLVDLDEATLTSARARVDRQVRHAQLVGAFPPDRVPGELVTSLDLASVSTSTAVIEAIVEDQKLKAALLAEVSGLVPAGTPLISNTSGIPIDDLAAAVSRPEELIGTHFMNPAYLIPMVETIVGPRTAPGIVSAVTGLLTRLGRRVVTVRDSPGFVTSRLLHPQINDAARLVAAGTASVSDVDTLLEGCLGHPTGPLRTADLIGIDNLVDALRVLAERTGNSHYEPCALLLEKVRAGELGRKSGRGFYEYGEVAL